MCTYRIKDYGVVLARVVFTFDDGDADEVVEFDEEAIHDALSRSQYVVIACPLTDATRGLVGEAELATMPPDAVVVNTARGPIVDTDALVATLRANKIRGAGAAFENQVLAPEAQ